MRISDLSQASGVPVATIKFYLREGLVPAGVLTGPNRAEYGAQHLYRLRLARALVLVGQLSIATVRELLTAIEHHQLSTQDIRSMVGRLTPSTPTAMAELSDVGDAELRVEELLGRLGWQVEEQVAARRRLTQVFAALQLLGCDSGVADALVPFGNCLRQLVAFESVTPPLQPAAMVARTVLVEVALTALVRLAHDRCEEALWQTR